MSSFWDPTTASGTRPHTSHISGSGSAVARARRERSPGGVPGSVLLPRVKYRDMLPRGGVRDRRAKAAEKAIPRKKSTRSGRADPAARTTKADQLDSDFRQRSRAAHEAKNKRVEDTLQVAEEKRATRAKARRDKYVSRRQHAQLVHEKQEQKLLAAREKQAAAARGENDVPPSTSSPERNQGHDKALLRKLQTERNTVRMLRAQVEGLQRGKQELEATLSVMEATTRDVIAEQEKASRPQTSAITARRMSGAGQKRRNSLKERSIAADLKTLQRDPNALRRRRWNAGVTKASLQKAKARPSAFGSHEQRGLDVINMQRRAAEMPGPQYNPVGASKGRVLVDGKNRAGGKFSQANPLSEFDIMRLRAKDIPAPVDSQPMGGFSTLHNTGGTISKSDPLSEFDVLRLRAADIPAPGNSQPDGGFSTLHSTGGQISKANPLSEFDIMRLRAKDIPAPCDDQPIGGFSTLHTAGGAMSKSKPLSEFDIMRLRAADIPAPCDDQPDFGFSTLHNSGGVISQSKPLSEFDILRLRAKDIPAPGYNVQIRTKLEGMTHNAGMRAQQELYRERIHKQSAAIDRRKRAELALDSLGTPMGQSELARALSEQQPTDKGTAVAQLRAATLPSDDSIAAASSSAPSVARRQRRASRRKSFEAEDMMPVLELARSSMRDDLVDDNMHNKNSGIGSGADGSGDGEVAAAQRPPRRRRPSRTGEDFVMQLEQARTLGVINDDED